MLLSRARPDEVPAPSTAAAASGPSSPAAQRLRAPRWREPRTLVGIALVVGSVLLGVRVVAVAGDTEPVLVSVIDLEPGRVLEATDLQLAEVGLDGDRAAQYHDAVPEGVGAGWVVRRPLREGELVPLDALGPPEGELAETRELTLALPTPETPPGLDVGSRVDVWIVPTAPSAGGEGDRLAERVVGGALVTAVDGGTDGLAGPVGDRRVTLAVGPGDVAASGGADLDALLARLVTAARDDAVYLTGLPGAADG